MGYTAPFDSLQGFEYKESGWALPGPADMKVPLISPDLHDDSIRNKTHHKGLWISVEPELVHDRTDPTSLIGSTSKGSFSTTKRKVGCSTRAYRSFLELELYLPIKPQTKRRKPYIRASPQSKSSFIHGFFSTTYLTTIRVAYKRCYS